MTNCSIDGCTKPARKRGCCVMHYARWLRHGDPLKTLTAADGEPARFIADVVMTQTEKTCLAWPFSRDAYGYGNIWHEGRMTSVHRLVCERENGSAPSEGYETAHSCGKGHEGCVSRHHLSWKTHAANMADKFIHGTMRGPLPRETFQADRRV